MGHEQRRRMDAPTSTILATRPTINEFQTGMDAQSAATERASRLGHQLGSWEPYGKASIKALCMNCGAEARVPYSVALAGYMPHEGPAVSTGVGTCAEQALRHPHRKRGTH